MLRVRLNRDFLFRRDFKACLKPGDRSVTLFSDAQAARLRDVDRDGGTVEARDLPLLAEQVLVTDADDARRETELRASIESHHRETATLVVMPTERCNLRCTYCYETFEKGRMSPPTVAATIECVRRGATRFSRFHLAWFGGEPLLATDIVERVTEEYRTARCTAGFPASVSMTTNGTKVRGGLDRLVPRNLVDVYQITVDGPPSIHDVQRKAANGRGTYVSVIQALHYLADHSHARVLLRVNVPFTDTDVVAQVQEWLRGDCEALRGRFGDRLRVSIVPVWDASTTDVRGICLTGAAQAGRYALLRSIAASLEGSSLAAELADTLREPGALSCYAGQPNSYVLGADGSVYKCSVALDLPSNRIGHLKPDGTMAVDTDCEQMWTGVNALNDARCGGCAFNVSCQGVFCPLERLQSGQPPCPTEKRFRDLFFGE